MKEKVQIFDMAFPDTTEIERQVIADAVANDYPLGDIIPLVHPDFFTTTTRRNMWDTIVAQYNAGKGTTIDIVGPMLGKPFFEEVIPYAANSKVYH